MQTFIANLKHAIRNRETVCLGGGVFHPEELKVVLAALEGTPTSREMLRAVYLDWINNYLTIERYAECNGLQPEDAEALIDLARRIFNQPHPEA